MNQPVSAEAALRARLQIPADARRVLVLAESSHWDTNWLQTSEGYYRSRLEPIFSAVLRQLESDPRRVFNVESVFFLKLFWERNPALRERLRTLLQERRLRLLASSFTTPDTLLPHPETVLRDFLLGQRWLEEQGLPCAPHTAYFPDNFGHSPHTPSLMRELGVNAVGVTRIDGMYFIAADYRPKEAFPLPGSTAHALEREHASLDFVWRDDAGAEVLCHWNAFTYFQGDMLAHKGIVRWAGKNFALSWRGRWHIAERLDGYAAQLAPLSRTPYLFCPIGMDFNEPIDALGELLDRYNLERYPETGTWVTLAGLDDYFALLELHREKLPVLAMDPNPYWMGFYASRPEVKQRATRIARALLAAEAHAACEAPDTQRDQAVRDGWHKLVLSNHHDYITGTSPDAVWHAEQRPWLDAAEQSAQLAAPPSAPRPRRSGGSVRHHRLDGEVHVETPHYHLTVSEERGGCLTRFAAGKDELLHGHGFDLVAFHDEGGLWRLGHEFHGGRFEELERASARPAQVEVVEHEGGLRLVVRSKLRGVPFVRTLVCDGERPALQVRVEGRAPRRVTVTSRFETALRPSELEMDTVGGAIRRPLERLYAPTFWPVPSRLSVPEAPGARALHALFDTPTAAAFNGAGHLEWIVARNAPKERAFRLLPVLAHPIGGTDDGMQSHSAALLWDWHGESGDPGHQRARAELDASGAREGLRERVRFGVPGVEVMALKRAERGAGLILRLASERPVHGSFTVALQGLHVRKAFRCDAHERDLEPLPVDGSGTVTARMSGFLATLRLVTG